MAETSSAPKPVVVRVKRKPFQTPLDAFWLEINERPLKRPLLDFGNLSVSDSAHMGFKIGERPLKRSLLGFENLSISESAQKVEFHTKKVFVQHLETISRSEVTLDIVRSFMEPGSSSVSESKSKIEERKNFKKNNKQGQLLIKAKQEKESLAKDAQFEQIWKSRKGNKGTAVENALQEMCHFYDIVRIDNEEKTMEVPQEDISLEDQRLLSSYLPLLREVIPNAAAEIESDMLGHSKQEDFVYDLYTVNDVVPVEDPSTSYPLVQVDNEDYYDGPDDSDYETDDSNAEDNPQNDYPDEISEEEDDASECDSEESEHSSASDEMSDEDVEHHGFSEDVADPLYDEEFVDYEGIGMYDGEDGDEDVDVDVDVEDWMMS